MKLNMHLVCAFVTAQLAEAAHIAAIYEGTPLVLMATSSKWSAL